ncbi:hypothetical protein NEMBOFW57_007315 [Staphylotrichum longicolle]|uniref:Hikeshi-like domain-containing protein n=1 Tax=Staphylotrichum longicolle TaxID=669026 RepID=A0AAD4EUW5_9PEZI|nr:hypothetical protein NEMBOFW57_007315 [Staphylotrichum longicolle]
MSQPLFGLVPAGQPMLITPPRPLAHHLLYAPPLGAGLQALLAHRRLPAARRHPAPATAAAIYLLTPPTSPAQTEPNSRFLGGIGPGKESAIFKLSPSPSSGFGSAAGGAGAGAQGNVVIGVSVEPADAVAAQIAQLPSSSPSSSASSTALVPASASSGSGQGQGQQPSTLVLAQRIIKNAFNFLSGFSGTAGQVEVVPLKAFEEWWRKFEGRVRSDPGFLERDD